MKNKNKRRCSRLMSAGCGGALLLLLLAGCALMQCLVLEVWDVDAKRLLLSWPVAKGDDFFLQYTHSTAKTIVEEHYIIEGADDIVATRMIFESGGAGLPDVVTEGTRFRIGSDGRFVLDDINHRFKLLHNIRVAHFYPFKILLKNTIIDLRDVARSRLIDIRVQNRFISKPFRQESQ